MTLSGAENRIVGSSEPAWQSYGTMLAWYRTSLMKRLVAIWGIASSLIAIGALAAGLTFWTSQVFSPNIRILVAILGGMATFFGPLYAMIRMPKLLGEERYLALFGQGVLFRDNEQISFIPWDELTEVQWNAQNNSLSFLCKQHPPMQITSVFLGVENKELAQEINRLRLRAQLGFRLTKPIRSGH